MLEGMIIGAVVGLIGAVVALITNAKRRDAVLKHLEAGDREAARAALDKRLPPATKKLSLNDILKQRERMAGLTLLGDTASIQSELAGLSGPLTAVTQVSCLGLLGLALRAEPGPAAAQLAELAAKMEREGGKMMGLVKKKTRACALLASSMAGAGIGPEEWKSLHSLTREQGMCQLVLWQALATALRKSGDTSQAATYEEKVRQRTRAFEAA